MTSLLLVDRAQPLADALANKLAIAIGAAAPRLTEVVVTTETDFSKARARLKAKRPALMVTALQLHEYNGLHLVYLAAAAGLPTRSIVHTETVDPDQAREIRAAGAFYETRERLTVALPAYVKAMLPAEDRRDAIQFDRRRLSRGGRRAADIRPSL